MKQKSFAQWITSAIGVAPTDEALFVRALTHGSHGGEDYQRLEFLGDRVLGLTIARALYDRFASEPEGKLSQRLNKLVAGSTCADVARQLGLADRLLLGKQARDDGAVKSDKVLGDVMESLIGAVYLDQGIDAAARFVLVHWTPRIDNLQDDVRHPKSRLQEWAAANRRKTPEYVLIERTGPHHDLQFHVEVRVPKLGSAAAKAGSIQAAETQAASRFLAEFAKESGGG